MNTLILDGSPKPNPQHSNTQLFCKTFIQGMEAPCEIRRIAGSNSSELAQYMKAFDEVLLFMPLYIHAMPGLVVKFFETLEPADTGKKIGFFIQAGFTETAQAKYVCAYFRKHGCKTELYLFGDSLQG